MRPRHAAKWPHLLHYCYVCCISRTSAWILTRAQNSSPPASRFRKRPVAQHQELNSRGTVVPRNNVPPQVCKWQETSGQVAVTEWSCRNALTQPASPRCSTTSVRYVLRSHLRESMCCTPTWVTWPQSFGVSAPDTVKGGLGAGHESALPPPAPPPALHAHGLVRMVRLIAPDLSDHFGPMKGQVCGALWKQVV